MELYLEFYKVLNKTQSLYSPIFLQDLVLTISLLDYPMAPSVTFGDSSLPEGAEIAGKLTSGNPGRGALPFRLNSRGASQSQIASSAPLRRDTPPQNGY